MSTRVIREVPDLEALPAGAVVMELGDDFDPNPSIWLRAAVEDAGLVWLEPGGIRDWPSSEITLPVAVLWTPRSSSPQADTAPCGEAASPAPAGETAVAGDASKLPAPEPGESSE